MSAAVKMVKETFIGLKDYYKKKVFERDNPLSWNERKKEELKEQYRKLKKKGICTRCKKRKVAKGVTKCSKCR